MNPERQQPILLPGEVRRAMMVVRDWFNEVLDSTSATVALEAVSFPEVDPERIALTDKPEEDGLFFNSTSGEILGGRQIIILSSLQTTIFSHLVLARGSVVSYEELSSLWPDGEFYLRVEENRERAWSLIKRIRKKLKKGVSSEFAGRLEGFPKDCRWRLWEKEEQGCFLE